MRNKTQIEIKILKYFIRYHKIYIRISEEFQNVTGFFYTYRVKILHLFNLFITLLCAPLGYSNVVLSNNKKPGKTNAISIYINILNLPENDTYIKVIQNIIVYF